MLQVETVAWMQKLKANNDGKEYYMLGNVVGFVNTLMVTPVGGNGGAMMYCQTHAFAYPIHGTCTECQNAVLEQPNE